MNLKMSPTAASCSSLLRAKTATKTFTTRKTIHLSFWLAPIVLLLLMQQKTCDCRYLPTRSQGDDKLDKMREMIKEILESSNEDPQQQMQLRPPNEANGNTLVQRANWWNKLNSAAAVADIMDIPKKHYAGHAAAYDGIRFY